MKKIETSFICPPIPYRHLDWIAYYEGEEENQKHGFGQTEQDAINDLMENYPCDCPLCGGSHGQNSLCQMPQEWNK